MLPVREVPGGGLKLNSQIVKKKRKFATFADLCVSMDAFKVDR